MELQTDDGYIIHQCLNGDSAAFGILVDRYKASIYALAYSKLGNFSDAEDAAQETFIKAYKNLRTLRRWDSFHIWLYSITINICRMRLRSKSKRPDREFAEDLKPKALDDLSVDSYHEKLIFDSLNEALDSLPDLHRQVLTLHYLGGMNIREVAEALGKSTRTIDRWLQSARSQLREEMLDMMDRTFEQQKLQAIFTLRIVEIAKHIRLTPLSLTKMLPWGLSLATGIIATFLSIGIHLSPMDYEQSDMSQSQLSESKVINVGEYPVDVMRISNISFMANSGGDGIGINEPSLQNALFMAPQAEGGTWTRKADMLTPRVWFATSVVNGKIYAFGGNDDHWNPGNILSTTEEYDPLTDKWIKKANMLTAKYALSACEANGKIYAVGGMSQAGPNDVFFSTVEEYDPKTDKWTKKADMPTARATSVSSLNGKIYAIGGHNSNKEDLSIVEEYDPKTDTWVRKADMLIPRRNLSTSAVNGKIYAINGFSPNHGDSLVAVEEYDPVADKWTRKANMSSPRFSVSTCAANGKIYAIGGWNSFDGEAQVLSVVEEYDPELDKWTEKSGMPTVRYGLSASEVNGRIYVIGGRASMQGWNIVSTVEEYDPQAKSKAINFKGKFPTTWGNMRTAMNR